MDKKQRRILEAMVKKRAFRSEEMPGFLLELICNAKMDARHNKLNELLKHDSKNRPRGQHSNRKAAR